MLKKINFINQNLLQFEKISIEEAITSNIDEAAIFNELSNQANTISSSLASNSQTPATDDESNGFVIVNGKKKQTINEKTSSTTNLENSNQNKPKNLTPDSSNNFNLVGQQQQQIPKKNVNRTQEHENSDSFNTPQSVHHNRGKF